MYILSDELYFPPAESAEVDGLIAVGGDLSAERLLLAYRNGIFPWSDDPVCWYNPDPRFVLFPDELKISKSMNSVLRSGEFRFTINKAFKQVMIQCQKTFRPEQDGTWISDGMINAYTNLHEQGFAHSAETWYNDELVGGLYGIRIGKIFFGESMFSTQSNASKFAFIKYVKQLERENVALIDCQVYTQHLESLGAREIEREKFLQIIEANI